MMNEKERNYDLQERLIEFAVRVLNVVESLPNSRVGNHVAGQLIRSGTSPAPKSNNGSTLPSFVSFLPSSFITPCSIFDIQFLRREIA